MKKVVTLLCSFISIFCLVYYSSKYYSSGFMHLNKSDMFLFTMIISIIVFVLVLGVINCYRVDKLKQQNELLLNRVLDLSEKLDVYHYSEMKSIHSNMEAILNGGEK